MSVPTKAAVKADPNLLFFSKPASPVGEKLVEVSIVGKRCVYLNDYRVAGGKPYFSENLPTHTLTTSLKEVIAAFAEDDILAAITESRAERAYFAAFHAQVDKQPA